MGTKTCHDVAVSSFPGLIIPRSHQSQVSSFPASRVPTRLMLCDILEQQTDETWINMKVGQGWRCGRCPQPRQTTPGSFNWDDRDQQTHEPSLAPTRSINPPDSSIRYYIPLLLGLCSLHRNPTYISLPRPSEITGNGYDMAGIRNDTQIQFQ